MRSINPFNFLSLNVSNPLSSDLGPKSTTGDLCAIYQNFVENDIDFGDNSDRLKAKHQHSFGQDLVSECSDVIRHNRRPSIGASDYKCSVEETFELVSHTMSETNCPNFNHADCLSPLYTQSVSQEHPLARTRVTGSDWSFPELEVFPSHHIDEIWEPRPPRCSNDTVFNDVSVDWDIDLTAKSTANASLMGTPANKHMPSYNYSTGLPKLSLNEKFPMYPQDDEFCDLKPTKYHSLSHLPLDNRLSQNISASKNCYNIPSATFLPIREDAIHEFGTTSSPTETSQQNTSQQSYPTNEGKIPTTSINSGSPFKETTGKGNYFEGMVHLDMKDLCISKSKSTPAYLPIPHQLRVCIENYPDEFINSLGLPSEVSRHIIESNILKKLKFTSGHKIGTLSREDRKLKIIKYRQKRENCSWNRKINYDCRKQVANSRLRIKGRFVAKRHAMSLFGNTKLSANHDLISNTVAKNT